MSEYISLRDVLIRDLEAQENALKGAESVYATDARALQDAQRKAHRSYEARAEIRRNVDRLKTALAIIEGDDKHPIVSEMNRQGGARA